jgi:hypothetical protein
MIGAYMNKLITVLIAGTCAMFLAGCASSTQKAAQGNYKTVTTPASELEQIKDKLAKDDVPCGIGMAVSNDEMIARTQAADEARTAVAEAMKTQISRYKEQYAKNVNGEAQKIWEEKANEYTQQELSGATVYKTITQFNEDEGKYKVYALIIMNPDVFKKAVMQAANSQEEFMLRAESADMQKRMDKASAAYQQQIQQQH